MSLIVSVWILSEVNAKMESDMQEIYWGEHLWRIKVQGSRSKRGGPSVPGTGLMERKKGEMEQDPMVLAPPRHVLCLPFVCGRSLAKE